MSITKTVQVDARVYWLNSGIDLQIGASVSIAATGTCTSAPGCTADANGVSGLPGKDSYVVPSATQGALIGYIGDVPPTGAKVAGAFFVGKSKNWASSAAGTLWLTVNDDVTGEYGRGYTDNSGQFTVTITVN